MDTTTEAVCGALAQARFTGVVHLDVPGDVGEDTLNFLIYSEGVLWDARSGGTAGVPGDQGRAAALRLLEAGKNPRILAGPAPTTPRAIHEPLSVLLGLAVRAGAAADLPAAESVPPLAPSAPLNEALAPLRRLQGYVGAAIADRGEPGVAPTVLAAEAVVPVVGAEIALAGAALANVPVLEAKVRAVRRLALDDAIEDIVITLAREYHVLRTVEPIAGRRGDREGATPTLFVYLVLSRSEGNLALAQRTLVAVTGALAGVRPPKRPALAPSRIPEPLRRR